MAPPLLYGIILTDECSDDIVDGFAPLINRVEASVETMEDSVSITRPDDIGLALKQIYTSRRQVLQSEVVSYLSDIQDHVLTMVSNLAHSEQRLSRSQDKYLSQLSFDSTRMRNQIVATLSRLTVIASCIVPMQIITGLFGMNITVPGKNSEGLGWWFGILGVILALIVLSLAIARRSRFL
jgi:magnesium transporter